MFRLINPCHSANPWHLLRNNLFPSVKRAASKRNYSNAIQIQRMNKKHDTLYYVGSVIITFFGLTYLSVPLYKLLCTTTGFDGTPITAKGTKFLPESMVPVLKSRPITITFDASLADTMRWTFRPETRQIKVLPGETSLSFFKASNPTNEDIVGISTYSVVPSKAAQYFNKEQKLMAGEEVDMPVFFYIDKEFASDPWMKDVNEITLHYTFFKSKNQS